MTQLLYSLQDEQFFNDRLFLFLVYLVFTVWAVEFYFEIKFVDFTDTHGQYNVISMIGFIYRHFIDFDNAYYELYIYMYNDKRH